MTNSQGWDEDRYRADPAVQEVFRGDRKTVAKFGHLSERRRQQDVEERARADVADLYDEQHHSEE